MQVRLTEDEIREAIKLYLEKRGIVVSDIELGSREWLAGHWASYWATATMIETT